MALAPCARDVIVSIVFLSSRRAAPPGAARLLAAGGATWTRMLHALAQDGRGRLAPWLAVAFAAGISGYFALPMEPDPRWGWAAAAAPLPALLLWRRHAVLAWLAGMPAAAALGVGLALVTAATRPPPLDLPRGAVVVSGTVRQVDILPEGRRVTLAAPSLDGGPPLPRSLRIRLRGEDPARPAPGDRITLRALVRAPAAPAYPGGWDFQRAAYFSGLGGSGFAIGPARVEPGGEAPPLAGLRATMERRVLAVLPAPEGAIAVALLVGGQSAIPEPDLAAMRDSGLAHILSVSGMHIAIVMGLVFAALRLLLAAIPPLALRLPVKAIAALAALAAGGFYMVLTGMQVPMLRSFAMAALATLALLAGRRALTTRAWALALAVVLAVDPAALLGPSLQMSFAAVLALIAGWEALRPWVRAWPGRQRWWGRLVLFLGGIVLTSVIAGAATTPFGLHHFGRVQLYGVVANALAVPLSSVLIMPAGLVAALAMPLGLEAWPLRAMGAGIDIMLAVAHSVAAWPHAALALPPLPLPGMVAIAAGLVLACLLRARARLLGVGLMAAGLAGGMLLHRPPDLLVSADARLIAARLDGEVWLQRGTGASGLTRESWLRLWAAAAAQPFPRTGEAAEGRLRCMPGQCSLAPLPEGPVVVLLRGAAPGEACATAALIVSAEPVRGRCAARVIDRFTVWREGAHAIWIGPAGIETLSDRAWRGARPWVPPLPQPRAAREPPAETE
jgi:competence protein ComEC